MSFLLKYIPTIGETYTSTATMVTVIASFVILIASIHGFRFYVDKTYNVREMSFDVMIMMLFGIIVYFMRRYGMTPLAIYKPTVAFTLVSLLPVVCALHVVFFYFNNPYWSRSDRYKHLWILSRIYVLAFMIIIFLCFFHRTVKYAGTAIMCLSAYYVIVWEEKLPNNGERLILPIVIAAISTAMTLPAYRFFHLASFREPQRLRVTKLANGNNGYVTVNTLEGDKPRTFTIERALYETLGKAGKCPESPHKISRTCIQNYVDWDTLHREKASPSTSHIQLH